MELSAPIFRLKHEARVLARKERIPLHEALDRIARREGFKTWSLLASRSFDREHGKTLLAELVPGDVVLLAARPRQGKTRLSLELMIEAMKGGHRCVFFTLDYNLADIARRFTELGEDLGAFGSRFTFDDSDVISAQYIIDRMDQALPGTVVVVDYLQLLDQKRENPDLADQLTALRDFARQRGLVLLFISQVDRRYDSTRRAYPRLADVRLPNPVDLTLFNKACFLNAGRMKIEAVPTT